MAQWVQVRLVSGRSAVRGGFEAKFVVWEIQELAELARVENCDKVFDILFFEKYKKTKQISKYETENL